MELGFDRIIFFTPVWDEIQSLTFSLSLSIDWKWLFRYLVHFRVIGGWRIEKSGWGEAREVMKSQDNWWTYQVSIILVIGQWKTHISNPETCWSCRLVTWLLYLLPHEFAVHCNTTDFFFSCSNFTRFPESIIKIEKGDKKKENNMKNKIVDIILNWRLPLLWWCNRLSSNANSWIVLVVPSYLLNWLIFLWDRLQNPSDGFQTLNEPHT